MFENFSHYKMDITSFQSSSYLGQSVKSEVKQEVVDNFYAETSSEIFVQDSLVSPEELLVCPEISPELGVKEEDEEDDNFDVSKFSAGFAQDDDSPQVSNISDADYDERGSLVKLDSPRSELQDSKRQNKRIGNSRKFKCRYCEFIFESKDELKNHLMTQCEKKYKCSLCNYECNRKMLLTVHILNHNNIKLFKCTECPFECNRKESLKRHMFTHGDIKRFKCTECTYQCNQKENLKRHMLTHGDMKLFKCPECDYGSNRKEALSSHMLSHGNVKLFKCVQCDYECNNTAHLKRHMLRHSDIKLFKCSECKYACNQKVHLTTHMRRHMKRR